MAHTDYTIFVYPYRCYKAALDVQLAQVVGNVQRSEANLLNMVSKLVPFLIHTRCCFPEITVSSSKKLLSDAPYQLASNSC
jgi:hypothetical protein